MLLRCKYAFKYVCDFDDIYYIESTIVNNGSFDIYLCMKIMYTSNDNNNIYVLTYYILDLQHDVR